MGVLPHNSFSVSHLSKLSPNPTPHTQPSPSPPPPPLPKDLMGSGSSGGSGSEEEADESAEDESAEDLMGSGSSGGSGSEEEADESAEVLERILLSVPSDSDEEMEAPGGLALDDAGFLELRDLEGEEEEQEEEEEEAELGDGEVVDGDGVLEDFGVLESELMGVDDMLVGLEEVVRR